MAFVCPAPTFMGKAIPQSSFKPAPGNPQIALKKDIQMKLAPPQNEAQPKKDFWKKAK